MTSALDRNKLASLYEREMAAFKEKTRRSGDLLSEATKLMPNGVPMAWMAGLIHHRPLYVTGGAGSCFNDVDGNSYIDFNLADLSNTIGYGETPVSTRVSEQAVRGVQFLQPTEDAIAVSAELKRRTGLPMWQYTLSASSANTEVIRIARAFTGREKIVLFEGKYHGHIDATMTEGGEPGSNTPGKPAGIGLSASAAANSITIPFNDPDALARALAQGDVALVMTEPALTNCHLVLPDPGFLADASRLSREAGALFALDETHTWQFAYGGMNRAAGPEAADIDFITLGKGMGSGVPLGAYGMTTELACFVEQNLDDYTETSHGLAIGGTTFASALTMAAARATLEECLTEQAYARITRLGKILADGIDAAIAQAGLPWRAFRYGPRSGFCLSPQLPRTYDQALASFDMEFINARRIFMANRGIWEAIAPAGPQVSFAHSEADVDHYLSVTREFLAEAITMPPKN